MATLLPIPSEAPVIRTVCKASDKAVLVEGLHTYLALDIELVCAGKHDDR